MLDTPEEMPDKATNQPLVTEAADLRLPSLFSGSIYHCNTKEILHRKHTAAISVSIDKKQLGVYRQYLQDLNVADSNSMLQDYTVGEIKRAVRSYIPRGLAIPLHQRARYKLLNLIFTIFPSSKLLWKDKAFLLYGTKISLGRDTKIDRLTKFYILADGKVELGEGVVLRSFAKGYHGGMPFPCTILVDGADAHVTIGKKSRLNGAYIHSQVTVSIGENCVIAAGVNIIDSNGHELISSNRTTGRDKPKPIEIGNNVWIGMNAIILKGTTVGNNSVIGAGSVVSGKFPENSLIVGNPARLVKHLDIPQEFSSKMPLQRGRTTT